MYVIMGNTNHVQETCTIFIRHCVVYVHDRDVENSLELMILFSSWEPFSRHEPGLRLLWFYADDDRELAGGRTWYVNVTILGPETIPVSFFLDVSVVFFGGN